METFNSNMNYFMVAANILQHHIADEGLIDEPLFDNLARYYSLCSVVEVGNGIYHPLSRPSPRLAVMGLVASILREFADLSSVAPLLDRRRGRKATAGLKASSLRKLCERARELGFDTLKIRRILEDRPAEEFQRRGIPSLWRGGKPPISTYEELQWVSFLPSLERASASKITPAFV